MFERYMHFNEIIILAISRVGQKHLSFKEYTSLKKKKKKFWVLKGQSISQGPPRIASESARRSHWRTLSLSVRVGIV